MISARHFARAATASLLIAGAFAAPAARAEPKAPPAATCENEIGLTMLASPLAPWKGVPLRVVFTSETPLDGELSLIGPDGAVAVSSRDRKGGPPYYWYAEVPVPAAGTWHAKLVREKASAECSTVTREIAVRRAR